MSRNLLSEFIYHLDTSRSMKLGHAPKRIQTWLEKAALPMDILRFLQWNWPQVDSQIGHISVLCSKNLLKAERMIALLPHRFLQLGYAPNGDFFVLDISTEQCRPGFVTHEEWNQKTSPRAIFQPIATSLESLLYRLVESRYVPTDYYAAKDFNEFLQAEQNPKQVSASNKRSRRRAATSRFGRDRQRGGKARK